MSGGLIIQLSRCPDLAVGCELGSYGVDLRAMSADQNFTKVSLFTFLTMARTIEYCLIVSSIAVAGLLIARGSEMNAMAAGGDPAKPRSHHVLEAAAVVAK